jgi:heme exporter protein B
MTPSLTQAAFALLKRDLGLSLTRGGGPLLAIGFYLTLMAMIPLSLGPDQAVLSRIAAGLTWLCLALSSLLSLERLFERDYEDAMFDVLRLGPLPLELIALLKCLSQWLGTGVILSLLTPVVMIILGAPVNMSLMALVSALLGSLSFALIGGMGASLSLGTRKGGVLMALLVLPARAPRGAHHVVQRGCPIAFGEEHGGRGLQEGLLPSCAAARCVRGPGHDKSVLVSTHRKDKVPCSGRSSTALIFRARSATTSTCRACS